MWTLVPHDVACFALRTLDVRDNNTSGHQFLSRVGMLHM